MAEPTSEWGREVVAAVDRLEEQMIRLTTGGRIAAWIAPIILALTAWTLTSVMTLQVKVVEAVSEQRRLNDNLERVLQQVQRMSDQERSDRDKAADLATTVAELKGIVKGLQEKPR
jgi:hypothetical protein